jgi:hypothetical protein
MLDRRLLTGMEPGKTNEPAFAIIKWSLAFRIAASY